MLISVVASDEKDHINLSLEHNVQKIFIFKNCFKVTQTIFVTTVISNATVRLYQANVTGTCVKIYGRK